MRLASQRPRVTVSKISPQVSDRQAITINPVASTADDDDPILRVAGCLSGLPLSFEDIERELYGKDYN